MVKLSKHFFSIEDNELLKKGYLEKSKIVLKQNYKPICNKKILKTESNFYTDETADFHDEEM